ERTSSQSVFAAVPAWAPPGDHHPSDAFAKLSSTSSALRSRSNVSAMEGFCPPSPGLSASCFSGGANMSGAAGRTEPTGRGSVGRVRGGGAGLGIATGCCCGGAGTLAAGATPDRDGGGPEISTVRVTITAGGSSSRAFCGGVGGGAGFGGGDAGRGGGLPGD